MLYVIRYNQAFPTRREEISYQRELARRLLALGVKREYDLELSTLRILSGPCGKPCFADSPVKFNLSHCSGLVCCAVSGEEIGVDAERVRPYREKTARRVCVQEELDFLSEVKDRDLAFTTLWTLKESLIKLSGEGFRYGFQNAVFQFADGVFRPLEPCLNTFSYFDFPGYVVSICCRGQLPGPIKKISIEEKIFNG